MPNTRTGKFALLAGTLGLFGCQMVGPVAIDQGRDRYNHIIQSTSKEQTFANILRVRDHEPTLFMDVTEVDATTTFSGTANGGAANIGARVGTSGGTLAGQTESVIGGGTYSESPLIRYQPLLGQSLVVQLATPVSTDALASLYDSNWGVAPLLDFATAFLTLDYDDSYAALNILTALDAHNTIELVAEKSDVTKAKDSTENATIKNPNGNVTLQVTNKASSSGGGGDALVVYNLRVGKHSKSRDSADDREDSYLWWRFHKLYDRTQAPSACPSSNPSNRDSDTTPPNPNKEDTKKCPPPYNLIELRTMPVKYATVVSDKFDSGAPLMKTFSALGILKNAAEPPDPRIGFVTPAFYRAIRSHPWNDLKTNPDLSFYTLLPENENDGDERPSDQNATNEVIDWLWRNPQKPFVYIPAADRDDVPGDDFIKGNRALGHLKRYILIVHSNNAPANAYVAHFVRGEWYYIDADDEISQKNFDLISLFLTMMAIPSGTPPLAPVISTGG